MSTSNKSLIVFQRLFKNFRTLNIKNENLLGRWNSTDNQDIKATLASMDSCGDSLCGKPDNYKDAITNILDENKLKNK